MKLVINPHIILGRMETQVDLLTRFGQRANDETVLMFANTMRELCNDMTKSLIATVQRDKLIADLNASIEQRIEQRQCEKTGGEI